MNELSLFSGAGGGCLASKLLGHRIVGYVEKEEYCKSVLRARIKDGMLDDAPIFDDVRTFDGLQYRHRVDLVSAGFPCQPFSVAGKRAGENDERNMWPDTLRIIREVQPKYAFLENVPGLLTSGYFGIVLSGLAKSGFDARWKVLGAADCGAPHIRKRLWILATNPLRDRRHDQQSKQIGRIYEREAITRNNGTPESLAYSIGMRELQQKGSEPKERRRPSNGMWWTVEPSVCRVAHGVASRVDRIKALGNGQVPIVAATAFKELIEGQSK